MPTFFVKSDASLTITKDPALDWESASESGDQRSARSGYDASTLTSFPAAGSRHPLNAPSLRYDPTNFNQIHDIHNLVDDSSTDDEDEDEDEEGGHRRMPGAVDLMNQLDHSFTDRYAPVRVGSTLWRRQVIVVLSMVALIALASAAIGYTVVSGDPPRKPVLAADLAADVEDPQQRPVAEKGGQQQLLEMAERVVLACSDRQYYEETSDCQKLCKSKVCCFDEGDYVTCDEGKGWDCAVYAGCVALLDGPASMGVGGYGH